MSEATRLDRPQMHCEGWGPHPSEYGHQHCDGGTGLWVTRRARWIRDGFYQCGTCKRAHDAWERTLNVSADANPQPRTLWSAEGGAA